MIIDAKHLAKAIELVKAVLPKRPSSPIFEHAIMLVHAGKISLSASNVQTTVSMHIPCSSDVPHSAFLVPIRKLKLPKSGDVSFLVSPGEFGDTLTVSIGASKIEYDVPKAGDYPQIPQASSQSGLLITARDLANLLTKTEYAIDKKATDNFRCILFEVDSDQLVAVATNRARLAVAKCSATTTNGDAIPQAIVPHESATVLLKLLRTLDSNANVKLTVNDNKLFVSSDGVSLSAVLYDGRYPKWRNVFPENISAVVRMDAKSVAESLERAAIEIPKDPKNHPGTVFEISENVLRLSTDSPSIGKAEETIPVVYAGEPFTVVFSPSYVLDFLKHVSARSVTMFYYGSKSPVMFRESESYKYLVMPR